MNISASTFESHPGDRVPEACEVLSASLAFSEAVQCLEAVGPAQESSGPETTEGSPELVGNSQMKRGSEK